MTNPRLNNYLGNEEVILWQYDKAVNLINVIKKWNGWAKASCEDFWNYFGNRMLPIDQADTYGLNVWGNLLGIPRPTIKIALGLDGGADYVTVPTVGNDDSSSDSESDEFDEYGYNSEGYRVSLVDEKKNLKIVTIKNDLYRGLLKGRYFLMCHTPTVPNYNRYLSLVFGTFKNNEEESSQRVYRDIFDADGEVEKLAGGDSYISRNIALDFMDMTMGFTFPKEATIEEAYLIFQHYDVVYPFPAGIRYPGEFLVDDLVIGLNTDQEPSTANNQNYRNFVDGLVLAEDPNPANPNGGIFSTTDRANYKVPSTVAGNAYIYKADIPEEDSESSEGSESDKGILVSLSFASIDNSKRQAVWIDWGNGECGYYYLPANKSDVRTFSTKYTVSGLFPIIVLFDTALVSLVTDVETWGDNLVHTYSLSGGAY